jgi:DNA-binding MarR family transcriptional regulator
MELSMGTRKFFRHFFSFLEKMSLPQMDALMFIAQNPGKQMKDVAEYMEISLAAATPLINKLIEAKHLKRIYDPNDRRAIKLEITESGKLKLEKESIEMRIKMGALFGKLTKEELKEYIRLHNKVLN